MLKFLLDEEIHYILKHIDMEDMIIYLSEHESKRDFILSFYSERVKEEFSKKIKHPGYFLRRNVIYVELNILNLCMQKSNEYYESLSYFNRFKFILRKILS